MKQLMEHFSWKPCDTLLSLGCGSAWWEVNLMIHQPCRELILVDPNSAMLNQEAVQESIHYFEQKTSLPFSTQFQIHNDHLTQLALAPESIDGIFVFNAWHEFDNLNDLSLAIKRIVKPGGWIVLEEELSIHQREIHEGCGKKLYFQEEVDQQMAGIEFHLHQKLLKEKQSFYLKYLKH